MNFSEILIPLVALAGSLLTFFSGFGLGTLLTPVLALFFPLEIAIAMTGIVHFSNNIFKWLLTRKEINLALWWKFGLSSMLGAALGAFALSYLSEWKSVYYTWAWGEKNFEILPFKFFMGLLILFFAAMEFVPTLKNWQAKEANLPLGGVISGFFGGLSGNQGALRAAFLSQAGLNKEAYIATGTAIALCVDITRIPVYFATERLAQIQNEIPLITTSIFTAFLGAWLGNKLLKKVTLPFVQYCVAALLFVVGLGMMAGIL